MAPPFVPDPTSTYPAPFVNPVLTPLTNGNSRTRLLRFTALRTFSPSVSVIDGVSTTARRNGSERTLIARSTRSLTDVYWLGASKPIGFSYEVSSRPSLAAVRFISLTNASSEPADATASVCAASLPLSSSRP